MMNKSFLHVSLCFRMYYAKVS